MSEAILHVFKFLIDLSNTRIQGEDVSSYEYSFHQNIKNTRPVTPGDQV
jgi:hypothetical protein